MGSGCQARRKFIDDAPALHHQHPGRALALRVAHGVHDAAIHDPHRQRARTNLVHRQRQHNGGLRGRSRMASVHGNVLEGLVCPGDQQRR